MVLMTTQAESAPDIVTFVMVRHRQGQMFWDCHTSQHGVVRVDDDGLFQRVGVIKPGDRRWTQPGEWIFIENNPIHVLVSSSGMVNTISLDEEYYPMTDDKKKKPADTETEKVISPKFKDGDLVKLIKPAKVYPSEKKNQPLFEFKVGTVGDIIDTDSGQGMLIIARSNGKGKTSYTLPIDYDEQKKLEPATQDDLHDYLAYIQPTNQVRDLSGLQPGDRIRLDFSNEIFTLANVDGNQLALLRENGESTFSVLRKNSVAEYHGINEAWQADRERATALPRARKRDGEKLNSPTTLDQGDDSPADESVELDVDGLREAIEALSAQLDEANAQNKRSAKSILRLTEERDEALREVTPLKREIDTIESRMQKQIDEVKSRNDELSHRLLAYQNENGYAMPKAPQMTSRDVVKPVSGCSESILQRYIVDRQADVLALQYVDGQWHAVFKYEINEPAQSVIDDVEAALNTSTPAHMPDQEGTFVWPDEGEDVAASLTPVANLIAQFGPEQVARGITQQIIATGNQAMAQAEAARTQPAQLPLIGE